MQAHTIPGPVSANNEQSTTEDMRRQEVRGPTMLDARCCAKLAGANYVCVMLQSTNSDHWAHRLYRLTINSGGGAWRLQHRRTISAIRIGHRTGKSRWHGAVRQGRRRCVATNLFHHLEALRRRARRHRGFCREGLPVRTHRMDAVASPVPDLAIQAMATLRWSRPRKLQQSCRMNTCENHRKRAQHPRCAIRASCGRRINGFAT